MVLVTGATGILGRVIVLELLRRGKAVRAAKRTTSNLQEVRESLCFYSENSDEVFAKIEWVDVDFNDLFGLEEVLDGITEVYHCAATVSFDPNLSKQMFKTNIDGTKNLLTACEKSSVKKFCFVSSVAVLDGVNEQGETDETCDYNTKLDHSTYAVSKHFSEMEVWRAEAEGLSTVIVNPGVIIGSGNWDSSSGLLFKNLLRGVTFAGGAPYIDVRDVAKISVELMEREIFGERFILVSENRRFHEVGTYVRRKFGKDAPKVIQRPLLKIVQVFAILFGWLFPALRMVNKVSIDTVDGLSNISNKKIRQTLGYDFIPVTESLDFHLENYISDLKK